MPRKVILDTDPGIDDAVALTMALFDPRLEVVAVTAVAGNVPAEIATRNVQAVIEQLDPPRWPRIGAAVEPDRGAPVDARHIHGPDGLGGADFEVSSLAQQHPSDRVLAEEIRAAREDLTIIALGPLTNLARAFVRDPSLIASVGQLIIMGGSIEQGGNVTPAAEFNIFCDPASAQTVFKSRTTKTLVPLDATNPVLFSYDFLDQLPPESTRAGAFLRRILPFAFRSHRRELGLEGIHLHDAVAVAAALAPGLFTTTAMAGAVETSGEVATGATVFDRRMVRQWRPNMDVVTETDVAAVKDCIIRGLAEAGRQT